MAHFGTVSTTAGAAWDRKWCHSVPGCTTSCAFCPEVHHQSSPRDPGCAISCSRRVTAVPRCATSCGRGVAAALRCATSRSRVSRDAPLVATAGSLPSKRCTTSCVRARLRDYCRSRLHHKLHLGCAYGPGMLHHLANRAATYVPDKTWCSSPLCPDVERWLGCLNQSRSP
jgi:hypothetical protein